MIQNLTIIFFRWFGSTQPPTSHPRYWDLEILHRSEDFIALLLGEKTNDFVPFWVFGGGDSFHLLC